jgi:hypothetical protein
VLPAAGRDLLLVDTVAYLRRGVAQRCRVGAAVEGSPRRRIPLRRPPGVLAQLQQLPRYAGGQVHAGAVTVGMAELDQVVQQVLIQDRQATAAIAAVPTGVVGAVPTRVVGVLARLGLVALLQSEVAAIAVARPRVVGPELYAAVRAGPDQDSSNGAANCGRCRTIWPACAPSGSACSWFSAG